MTILLQLLPILPNSCLPCLRHLECPYHSGTCSQRRFLLEDLDWPSIRPPLFSPFRSMSFSRGKVCVVIVARGH